MSNNDPKKLDPKELEKLKNLEHEKQEWQAMPKIRESKPNENPSPSPNPPKEDKK
jgi:hypothetical protein